MWFLCTLWTCVSLFVYGLFELENAWFRFLWQEHVFVSLLWWFCYISANMYRLKSESVTGSCNAWGFVASFKRICFHWRVVYMHSNDIGEQESRCAIFILLCSLSGGHTFRAIRVFVPEMEHWRYENLMDTITWNEHYYSGCYPVMYNYPLKGLESLAAM